MGIVIREKMGVKSRLKHVALYWGIPLTCAEFVFRPALHPWSLYPLVAVPIFLLTTATAFVVDLAIVKAGAHLAGPPR